MFRAIWIASLISNFGGLIQSIGASWMMTSLTHSPALVALVQSSAVLPIMLLSLWAGAIADNLDRRKIMLAAQGFMLLVAALLAFMAWRELLTPWLLLGLTFLLGCGIALNSPAWAATAGDLVPRPMLPAAVALNSMGFNLARAAGPAVGGVIVAVAGSAAAFVVNAFSYVALIATLARWKPERPVSPLPRERIADAMVAGLRYVAMSPHIGVVLLRSGMFGISASAIMALMPIVVRDQIGGGALVFGIFSGAFGLGAVSGALASTRLRARYTTERIVRTAIAGIALGCAVIGTSTQPAITVLGLLFSGACWVLILSSFNVTIQLATPRWVVARVLSLFQMVAFGAMAIGAWLFGELAEARGVDTALLAAGAVQLLGLAAALRLPLPAAEAMNLDPIARWTEPETAVQVEPRSGPIVVTIEYRIAESTIPAFLAAMDERRRIRIRDGARNWTLLRDLGDAELWLERYHVATWVDYVRHNQRRTHADAANFEQIRGLNISDQLVIHRMIERQTSALPAARASPESGDPA